MMRKLNLILLGAPGAGKGTQAELISERYGIPAISTGQIIREEIASGSELGKQVKEYTSQGMLVPDSVVIDIIKARLAKDDCVNGFILDGFPRTIGQAEVLDDMLNKIGASLTAVVSIMIPDEMVIERISHRAAIEGRADDADVEIIRHRIETYHAQTEPEIAYYQKSGKYHEVDGVGTIEEVRDRIFALVDRF